MAKSLAIHVMPDSNPTNIWQMCEFLSRNPDQTFVTGKELIELLKDNGQSTNDWVHSTAGYMGLLDKKTGEIKLSDLGLAFSKVRDDARNDLLHFLIYTGWSRRNPTEFLQSWGYQQACNQYWEAGSVELTSQYIDLQVGEIINLAQLYFTELNVGEFDDVSFSRKSIRGVMNYLESVNPSVIVDKTTYQRRSFCPPELMMMAVGYVVSQEDNAVGVDILLTPEKREQICKICLLEPDSFDRALDWALPIFPSLVSPGTTAGFYGRFVRLHRIPTLQDVIR